MKIIILLILSFLISTNSFAALTVDNVPRTKTGGTTPALQDSVLSQQNSNIGVGTVGPAQKLEVAGTVQSTGIKMTTNPSNGYVLVTNSLGVGTWMSTSTINSGTSSSLASNGTNCSSGSFPLGVDASGNSESCTVATTGTVTSIATTSPITGGTITGTGTIAINNAAADGSTKGAASFTAADFDASSGNISLDYTNGQAASGSNKGYLTSADWTTFNNKVTSPWFRQAQTNGNVGVGTYDKVGLGTTFGNSSLVVMPGLNSGNVGIGTWNAITALEVIGTAKATALRATGISGSTQCVQADTNGNLTGTGSACGGSGATPGGALGALQYNSPVGTFAGDESKFSFNGTNVGINTTNGVGALDIRSASTALPSNNTTGNIRLIDTTAFAPGTGGELLFGGMYSSTDLAFTVGGIKAEKRNGTSGHYGFGLSLWSRPDGDITMRRMTIADDGNVGIGTAIPVAKFEVAGISRSTGLQLNLAPLAGGNVLVSNSVGVGTWMPPSTLPGGAEVNNLETIAQGILDDEIPIGSAADDTVYTAIPDCDDSGGNHLNYDTATNALSCGTSSSGGGSSQWKTQASVGIGTVDAVGVGTYTWGSKLTVMGGVGVGTVGSSLYVTNSAGDGNLIVEKNVGVGTTAPSSRLVVTQQATTQAPVSGSTAQFVGTDANPLRVTLDTHNNSSSSGTALMFRRSRGTAASPSAVTAGDTIFSLNGRGYGATGYAAASTGLISMKANQNFTDANNGTYISFETTPDGSVTAAERMRIMANGNVGVGTVTADLAKLETTGFRLNTNPAASAVLVSGATGIGTWMNANTIPTSLTLTTTGSSGASTLTGNVLNVPQYSGGSSNWFTQNESTGNVGVGTYNRVGIGTFFGNGSLVVLPGNNSGNVGIGTWNPITALEVIGTAKATALRATGISGSTQCVRADTNGNLSGTGSDCGAGGGSNYWVLGSDNGVGNIGIGTTVNGVGIGTTFGTAQLAVMSGNVGIGTWVPQNALVVMNGNVGIGSFRPHTTLVVQSGANVTAFNGQAMQGNVAGNLGISNINTSASSAVNVTGGAAVGSGLYLVSTSNASAAGVDFIQLKGNASGATVLMTARGNGNIGIGTISPYAKLQIIGNIGIGTGQSSSFQGTVPPNGGMIVETNIGIGTVNPGTSLDVNGAVRISNAGDTYFQGNVGLGTTIPMNTLSVLGNVGIGSTKFGGNVCVGGLEVGNSGGLCVSHNVGIGTLIPEGPLVVRSSTNNIGWSIQNAANQACNTTCSAACVFGIDTSAIGNLLACTDASADSCLCAGSN